MRRASKRVEQVASIPTSGAAHSIAFPDGGLYVLADSQPYPQAMVVDAGPHGVNRAGHGHADALSLRLVMDGRRWLVDAGSGVYISKDPAERNILRGTGAHNTMRVDGVDQAVADGPFSWTHIPAAQAEHWIAGKSFTYFAGSHNGYARLADPVMHRRQILKIAGGPWLVRDVALGRAEHELEVSWHFAPDLDVRSIAPGQWEITKAGDGSEEVAGDDMSGARLSLMVPEETVWQAGAELTKTRLSPAYGALQPAPLVRAHARVLLPAETATALIAGRVERPPESGRYVEKGVEGNAGTRLTSMAQAQVQLYQLDYHDGSHGFYFARSESEWSSGPWSSDAQALYCRLENEKLEHLIVIGGGNVAWQGQALLKGGRPSAYFEWRRQDAIANRERGDSVTPFFEELTGEVLARNTRS